MAGIHLQNKMILVIPRSVEPLPMDETEIRLCRLAVWQVMIYVTLRDQSAIHASCGVRVEISTGSMPMAEVCVPGLSGNKKTSFRADGLKLSKPKPSESDQNPQSQTGTVSMSPSGASLRSAKQGGNTSQCTLLVADQGDSESFLVQELMTRGDVYLSQKETWTLNINLERWLFLQTSGCSSTIPTRGATLFSRQNKEH